MKHTHTQKCSVQGYTNTNTIPRGRKVDHMKNTFRNSILLLLVLVLVLAAVPAGAVRIWRCEKDNTVNCTLACTKCGNVKFGLVQFGHYPQTTEGNDNTPIEWQILDVQDGKVLLISKYGLDAKPYHEDWTNITWENCTLRTWLNGEFLNKAFTPKEQANILLTNVDNSKSQGYSEWDTDGGNNTQDRVFLLSYAEANKYFGVNHYSVDKPKGYPNKDSRVKPTAYAIAQGAYTNSDYKTSESAETGLWWLRSPGYDWNSAANVTTNGSLSGSYVYRDSGYIRPALWVDLNTLNILVY